LKKKEKPRKNGEGKKWRKKKFIQEKKEKDKQ